MFMNENNAFKKKYLYLGHRKFFLTCVFLIKFFSIFFIAGANNCIRKR